jgi:hypothetical protein
MAATGLNNCVWVVALLLIPSVLALGQTPENETGKQSADARAALGSVANDLTASDAADAISHFDKNMPNYGKLDNYFNGLVNAFYVSNGIQVLDETDERDQTKLTVRWDMTLTDLQSYYTEDRSGELSVCLVRKDGKWRISELSPIALFDPAKGASRPAPKS